MDTIITLNGKHSGFARMLDTGEGCEFYFNGIPDDCSIFAVIGDKALPLEDARSYASQIRGLLVVKNFPDHHIIMQGTIRGKCASLEHAKSNLRLKLNAQIENQSTQIESAELLSPYDTDQDQPKSVILSDILNNAKRLFNDDDAATQIQAEKSAHSNTTLTNVTDTKNCPHPNNPFFLTYPHSCWRRIRNRCGFYLEGQIELEGIRMIAQAIPATQVNVNSLGRNGYSKIITDTGGNRYVMRIVRTNMNSMNKTNEKIEH